MRKILRSVFIAVIFTFLGTISAPPLYASDEFSTAYEIVYNVLPSGLTTTRQVVKLTNKKEYLYATEYSVTIGSTKLTDITASDDFGELKPQIDPQNNATNIKLNFDHKIIGKDKTHTMVLTYKTPDFATVKGKVLEVGFPLLLNSKDLEDYTVTVNIPDKFGKPTQIVPQPNTTEQQNTFTSYSFRKEDIAGAKGITATFGTEQILDFNLRYTLENTEVIKGKTEIALPSDNAHQAILYSKIEPAPQNIKVDSDGNWLAEYILDPKSTLVIQAAGTAKINFFPNKSFSRDLSETEIKEYTKPDRYWESNDASVKELASTLNTPEEIYKYLVNNFIYDYGRLDDNTERYGAIKALANPDNAICMEFTDAFIGLARAANIPAREHNGYAYTENDRLRPLSLSQDVLHAWPEYYDKDKKEWIQVDPTWGNTTGGLDFFNKFDLDHFSFVTHGIESSYPVTVASYKTANTQGKDISVEFANEYKPVQDVSLTVDILSSGISGLSIPGKVTVKNTGNTALYSLPVSLEIRHKNSSVWDDTVTIDTLPPYSQVEYPVNFATTWQTDSGDYSLHAAAFNKEQEAVTTVKQLVNHKLLIVVMGGSLGSLVWFIGYLIGKTIIRKRVYSYSSYR